MHFSHLLFTALYEESRIGLETNTHTIVILNPKLDVKGQTVTGPLLHITDIKQTVIRLVMRNHVSQRARGSDGEIKLLLGHRKTRFLNSKP